QTLSQRYQVDGAFYRLTITFVFMCLTIINMCKRPAVYDHVRCKRSEVKIIRMAGFQCVVINSFGGRVVQVAAHYCPALFLKITEAIAAQQTVCTGNKHFHKIQSASKYQVSI